MLKSLNQFIFRIHRKTLQLNLNFQSTNQRIRANKVKDFFLLKKRKIIDDAETDITNLLTYYQLKSKIEKQRINLLAIYQDLNNEKIRLKINPGEILLFIDSLGNLKCTNDLIVNFLKNLCNIISDESQISKNVNNKELLIHLLILKNQPQKRNDLLIEMHIKLLEQKIHHSIILNNDSSNVYKVHSIKI